MHLREEGNSSMISASEKLLTCRICGTNNLEKYLDLGSQPPSNSFLYPDQLLSEKKYPLEVLLCTDCGLSQLSTTVSSEEIFIEYAYRSSSSRALIQSFSELASKVNGIVESKVNKGSQLIVDIGCNDGLLLHQFSNSDYRLLGVEPSSAAEDARLSGLTVEQIFFDSNSAIALRENYGPAACLIVTNVLAHVPDIRSFVQGVSHWLASDGVFIVEFPYVLDMVKNRWFDTVYHEHRSYLGISPLKLLFDDYGLEIFDIDKCEVGGSGPFLRIYVQKKSQVNLNQYEIVEYYMKEESIFNITNPASYLSFSEQVQRLADGVNTQLNSWIKEGKSIGGFGAPAKGNTFLNYLGLNSSQITLIADNTVEKIGKMTPGSHIPIVTDQEFIDRKFDLALLLSWNYLEYFLENAKYINQGGLFYVPFPTPRLIGKNSIRRSL